MISCNYRLSIFIKTITYIIMRDIFGMQVKIHKRIPEMRSEHHGAMPGTQRGAGMNARCSKGLQAIEHL